MSYWPRRSGLPYYAAVLRLLRAFGPRESILDVGCFDTPCATWGSFTRRYTIDPRARPALPGVLPIVGSWPDARTLVPLPVSVVLCLQTLEHVSDPAAFARELFAAADVAVIISVPWCWPAGATASHIHDPVDAAKLRQWTGREPDELVVSGKPERAVMVYLVR